MRNSFYCYVVSMFCVASVLMFIFALLLIYMSMTNIFIVVFLFYIHQC